MDGTTVERDLVREWALEWTKHTNLRFEFVDTYSDASLAEIRIQLTHGLGSWSEVGTDCTYSDARANQRNVAPGAIYSSMNHDFRMYFEYKKKKPSMAQVYDHCISSTILHEFGHAISLVHEHQRPDAQIPYVSDKKIYEFYAQPANRWPVQTTFDNVLRRYTDAELIKSENADHQSIMFYSIPKELLTTGREIPGNCDLSETDKRVARAQYPTMVRPR